MAQGSQSPGWRITSTHALREAARKRPGLIVVAGADYAAHVGGAGPGGGYRTDLRSWQSLKTAAVQAETGQLADVLMLAAAQGSEAEGDLLGSAHALRDAMHDLPDKIRVVGPTYHLLQHHAVDDTHMSARGYHDLGEIYGAAYAEEIGRGRRWRPLDLEAVAYDGATGVLVTLTGGGPGDLALDTTTISARPGEPGAHGFYLWSEGVAHPVAGVEIMAHRQIRLTLPFAPPPGVRAVATAAKGYGATRDTTFLPRANLRTDVPFLQGRFVQHFHWVIPAIVAF